MSSCIVHAASNDQQNAVACSIASSHEDLHEVTSISSRVDVNSQSVPQGIVSQRMGLCLELRSTATVISQPKIYKYILIKIFSNKSSLIIQNISN